MAGKTYTQKIQFKGSFDGTEVLSGLKKIRQSISDAGADASLFKGVDKDIAQTEKLITDLLAQIQKGFSNPQHNMNDYAQNKNHTQLKSFLYEEILFLTGRQTQHH